MEDLFPTLFSKTFFVLGIQLLITWLSGFMTLGIFRYVYDRWEIDLYDETRRYTLILLLFDICLFVTLILSPMNSLQAIYIFALWSIVTGIELTLSLISVDEYLGPKLLGITATAVFVTALIGVYSGADYGYIHSFIFLLLTVVILIYLFDFLVTLPGIVLKYVSGLAIVVFTLYLLFDFNRLSKMNSASINDWDTAIFTSIKIYLDIINLFISLLDFLR